MEPAFQVILVDVRRKFPHNVGANLARTADVLSPHIWPENIEEGFRIQRWILRKITGEARDTTCVPKQTQIKFDKIGLLQAIAEWLPFFKHLTSTLKPCQDAMTQWIYSTSLYNTLKQKTYVDDKPNPAKHGQGNRHPYAGTGHAPKKPIHSRQQNILRINVPQAELRDSQCLITMVNVSRKINWKCGIFSLRDMLSFPGKINIQE